ncbi:hypothetical protein ANAEL_00294 [Anaerolineales bacterium]|nr:hypothetical protein ANAEL_00294 [Anaerolineales bacterium]
MSLLNRFGLAIKTDSVTPASRSYRPPSWPPPRDWVCIEDANGNVVSRWGDPIWRFYPLAGKPLTLNFGDGPQLVQTTPIDRDNADLLRLLATWRGWGPRGARTALSLKNNFFTPMRAIIALCSREGILASELMRFPAVRAKVSQVISPSYFDIVISELQRVLDARQELGFILLDQHGLRQLVATKPEHTVRQTEYIPPRIWTYQVNRLRECLDDYMAHRQKVEDCFHFCVDAYARNYGTLAAALTDKARPSRLPFQNISKRRNGAKTDCQFHGHFLHTAVRFGIYELLGRWVEEPVACLGNKGISSFTSYLTLVQNVGLAYLLNFSLMRHDEGRSLRADCLYFEEDEKLGKIPILCGGTTKTDPDSDARWPTSPSVKVAVDSMTSVSFLRIRCAQETPLVAPSAEDIANPFLFDRAFEPWAGNESKPYLVRPGSRGYQHVLSQYPKLFDLRALEITEEDFKIARSVNPDLNPEVFQIGKKWPLAWHQLRRTGAVNMFSSGIVSDSTMQFQMKHLTRAMPLYYGRGHSSLSLNEEVRTLLVNAQYEVMGREIAAIISDRFVSPYGEDHKKRMVDLIGFQKEVNVLSEEDANQFEAAARRGAISFRATVLGGCMKNGRCDGDCIESIANCAGGDGSAPCLDVLFDRQRAGKNQILLDSIKLQIKSTPPETPRYRALEKEKRGLENYFAFINQ